MNDTHSFNPPHWLKNPHIQNIISSSKLRLALLKFKHSNFRQARQIIDIRTAGNVHLQGVLNISPKRPSQSKTPSTHLVILFHGWEGSVNSGYVYSLAAHLFDQGYDTLRLNFRDHGDTHALNKEIFHSARLQEIVDAVAWIQQNLDYEHYSIMGFSLGGNFAIRVISQAKQLPKPISATMAVCPVFDPDATMQAFPNIPFFYEKYFVKKWKKSLSKKLATFPEYDYHAALKQAKSLDDLNQYFIPRHTEFDSVAEYIRAYTLTPEIFNRIEDKTLIVAASDDPVIPIKQVREAPYNEHVTIEEHAYGSHCAFLDKLSLSSWIHKRAIRLLRAC